jgi:broad specificity phosphatase PhoE
MIALLIRHGQTNWNEERVFRGRIDVKLNAKGCEQSEIIGDALSAVPLTAVYSSPLSRAMETAERIVQRQQQGGMQVQPHGELIDFDFGKWQGKRISEVKFTDPDIFELWESHPERVRIPGAETLQEVRERMMAGLDEILAHHPEGTVVLVSHGLTNKVLLCALLGLDNSHFWKIRQDNGAISIFKYTGEGSKLILMNETSHLQPISEIVEDVKNLENPLG